MWMFPISIACGNSFILKSSEQTPLAALWLAEYFSDAFLELEDDLGYCFYAKEIA